MVGDDPSSTRGTSITGDSITVASSAAPVVAGSRRSPNNCVQATNPSATAAPARRSTSNGPPIAAAAPQSPATPRASLPSPCHTLDPDPSANTGAQCEPTVTRRSHGRPFISPPRPRVPGPRRNPRARALRAPSRGSPPPRLCSLPRARVGRLPRGPPPVPRTSGTPSALGRDRWTGRVTTRGGVRPEARNPHSGGDTSDLGSLARGYCPHLLLVAGMGLSSGLDMNIGHRRIV